MIEQYVQRVIEQEQEIKDLKRQLANKDLDIVSLEVENMQLREASKCSWESSELFEIPV